MNIVTSAFGNAGQKCSACSLLLVERSVYEDENFRSKLKDAATSLKTGSVWNAGNIVGPMITNKNDKLLQAFNLEPGESWLDSPAFHRPQRVHPLHQLSNGGKTGKFLIPHRIVRSPAERGLYREP